MIGSFESFVRSRDFLVCFDSDGCVMDTMKVKHVSCFGPCMVDEWELWKYKDETLSLWNDINLYRQTRGINRFKGLAVTLGIIDEKYTRIRGIDALSAWCESAAALSEDALREAVMLSHSGEERECLAKALSWSHTVNGMIKALPSDALVPFEDAMQGLAYAHSVADVAAVSSANRESVSEEWARYGLLSYTDILLTQELGRKEYCIGRMLSLGYKRERVLMVGDSMGDMRSAEACGISFFPIMHGRENECWRELCEAGLSRLLDGTFSGEYQRRIKNEFLNNFK